MLSQNLHGFVLLRLVAHIHPKQQPAPRELFLDARGMLLVDQPAKGAAD
jgi:hypothetical protein